MYYTKLHYLIIFYICNQNIKNIINILIYIFVFILLLIFFSILGVTEESVLSLDTIVPNTKEEFEQYGSVLTQKLNQFAKHSEFPLFGEELIKSVALNCK